MAKKTIPNEAVAAPPEVLSGADIASAQAPFIFFEEARTFGHNNGLIRITLEAGRIYSGSQPGSAKLDHVMVAHLRTNIAGARALRNAIDRVLLLAAQTAPQKN